LVHVEKNKALAESILPIKADEKVQVLGLY